VQRVQPFGAIADQIVFREQALERGRNERFAAMVERQSRFVFRVAYALLRNAEDSEDAVQDTFLKLYRSGAWERMDDERGFLARTAWRVAIDRARRLKTVSSDAEALCACPNPESAAIEKDRHATVRRLVDTLPEELRQPLALSTVDDLTSREIAAILGIPEGTVRTRLSRARTLLREKLIALGVQMR
jgi:RNA polymerase sigma-70 factor (ECF subfamily)